jgi:hypothetical protein
MKHGFVLILILLASVLSGAKGASALPPNPKKSQRTADAHKHGATSESDTSPEACPSVTVILKEIPAPEAKKITAVIQPQPYEHWWDSPNAPSWAIFFLTIPYVLVSVGAFVVAYRAANSAQSSADAATKSANAVAEELQLTIRPKIRFVGDTVFIQGTEMSAYYTVINKGHADANVRLKRVRLWRHYTDIPWPSEIPSGDVVNDVIIPQTFIAGDYRSSQLKIGLSASGGRTPYTDWQLFTEGKLLVCLSGFAEYADISDTTFRRIRQTYFCRVWSLAEKRFIVPKDMPRSFNRST